MARPTLEPCYDAPAVKRLCACAFILAAVAAGCSRDRWPAPPAVDAGAYRQEYDAWLQGERAYVSAVLSVIGIWPLNEGDTSFGADPTLSIVLPAAQLPPIAGTFRRAGTSVTIIPAAKSDLRWTDRSRVEGERPVKSVVAGRLRLDVTDVGDDRRWVQATDTTHPAMTAPPALPSYPVDDHWRVMARFDAFKPPKRVRVPDVRGGSMEFTAVGQLVFRLDGEERRLTAMGVQDNPRFAVWFKDRTNGLTTYGGYRVVRPLVVPDGQWTVLDFNFAYNPPCAYSTFTTCPLSPPENRLPVAIEAGLKELPSAKGY
jgi:uncharacterized protein (DUF1684 family)